MEIWKNKVYKFYINFVFKNGLLKYPLDILEICKKMNINIIEYDDSSKCCYISKDGFSKFKNDKYYIFLNKNNSNNRKKFTISHELGHIILNHFKDNEPLIAHCNIDEQKEWEANMFARLLLAPPHITYKLDKKEISKKLKISKQMSDIVFEYRKMDYNNLVDKVPGAYFKIDI